MVKPVAQDPLQQPVGVATALLLVLATAGTVTALQERTVLEERVPTPYPNADGEPADAWMRVNLATADAGAPGHGVDVEVREPWTAMPALHGIVDSWLRVLDLSYMPTVDTTMPQDAVDVGQDTWATTWTSEDGSDASSVRTQVVCDPTCETRTYEGGCEDTSEGTTVCKSDVDVTTDDGEVHVEQRTVQRSTSSDGGSTHQESHQSSTTVVRSG